jgi:hypothetical protein
VKLKKIATETSEMLKVLEVKNVYLELMCLNDVKCLKNGSASDNAKITSEKMLAEIFLIKILFITNLSRKEHTVNGKFAKNV